MPDYKTHPVLSPIPAASLGLSLSLRYLGFRVSCTSMENNSSPSSSPSPRTDVLANSPVSAPSAIDFLSLCHRLKTTKRAGWVKREIKNPESIADHMHRMGLMALIFPHMSGINRDRCVKMAIVHDIAEAIVGDITPLDGVSKSEKNRREKEAIDYICNLLGGGYSAMEIGKLWAEYEENSTLEAKVVKDFDKSKQRTWMSFFSQRLESSRPRWAKHGLQKLCREEGNNTDSMETPLMSRRRKQH